MRKNFEDNSKGANMLTNLFVFLAFYSSDLNDNQRIDSDGMIERTYYFEQYRKEDHCLLYTSPSPRDQ